MWFQQKVFFPGYREGVFNRRYFQRQEHQKCPKDLPPAETLPQKHIEIFLDDIRKIEIAKTNNHSVLGSMNDLTFQLKYRIADEGGLLNADITKLIHDLNRIPISAIEEIYSIYELRKLLNKLSR
jgi:hypothetical protein